MLTKFQGGQKVTRHHFLKLYLLIRYFNIHKSRSDHCNPTRRQLWSTSIDTYCWWSSVWKGTKRRTVSTSGNSPTVEILVLQVYGMIPCHVHYFCQVYKWPLTNTDIHNYKCFRNHHYPKCVGSHHCQCHGLFESHLPSTEADPPRRAAKWTGSGPPKSCSRTPVTAHAAVDRCVVCGSNRIGDLSVAPPVFAVLPARSATVHECRECFAGHWWFSLDPLPENKTSCWVLLRGLKCSSEGKSWHCFVHQDLKAPKKQAKTFSLPPSCELQNR